MTDPIASAATQAETAVKADVKTEVATVENGVTSEFGTIETEVKAALAADIVKARAVLAKFGIAIAALIVGWALGKLF